MGECSPTTLQHILIGSPHISHISYHISPPCSPYRLVPLTYSFLPTHQIRYVNFCAFDPLLLNCRFASIGPVAGSPFLGYAQVPDRALSVIDFHGTADLTIPYSLPTSEGSGPDGTVISFDGYFYYDYDYPPQKQKRYFYYDKPRVISSWAEGLDCGPASPWPTSMDGVQVFCFCFLAGFDKSHNFESQLRTSPVSSTPSAVEGVRWFTATQTMDTTILLDLTGLNHI